MTKDEFVGMIARFTKDNPEDWTHDEMQSTILDLIRIAQNIQDANHPDGTGSYDENLNYNDGGDGNGEGEE